MKPQRKNGNVASAIALFVLVAAAHAAAAERAAYFYEVQNVSQADWQRQIAKWHSEGITQAIVSLEAGSTLLLEEPRHSQRLAELFTLAAAIGIRIEGLILQHPSWALRPQAARERLRIVVEFMRRYPGLMDGVQIDVEVYTAPELFAPQTAWQKFTALVSALREELTDAPGNIRLTAALPWWAAYALSADELRTITAALDGIVFMAYGEVGGEPVAADVATFRRKVHPALELLSGRGTTLRVGVAKYEHPSPLALARHAQKLEELLEGMPGFAGIAYFHESAEFLATAKPLPAYRANLKQGAAKSRAEN